MISVLSGSASGEQVRISEVNLEEFRARFVLVSKLPKAMGVGSRTLMDYLASRDIRPVDFYKEEKLRQKVYDRLELFNINLTVNDHPYGAIR